jgi:hypothetical protein
MPNEIIMERNEAMEKAIDESTHLYINDEDDHGCFRRHSERVYKAGYLAAQESRHPEAQDARESTENENDK